MRRNLGAMVSAVVLYALACLSPASAQEQFIPAWANPGPYGNVQQVGHIQPRLAPCYGDDCDVCNSCPPMMGCPPQCPPGHQKPCGKGLCDLLPCCSGALAEYTRFGPYFGVGFSLLRPQWDQNPAFSIVRFQDINIIGNQTVGEFDYPFKVTPRFFCGYSDISTGLGMRASLMLYDHNADEINLAFGSAQSAGGLGFVAPFVGANPGIVDAPFNQADDDSISLHNSLEMQVADIEMTKVYGEDGHKLVLSFGGRYAYVKQDYSAQLLGTVSGLPVESQTLKYRNRFEGWGPVVGADVILPAKIGWVSLYGNFKYSILVGDNDQSAVLTGSVIDINNPQAPPTPINGGRRFTQEDLINVGEGECGFELYYHTPCVLMTIRSGVLFQTWSDIGNAVNLDDNMTLFGWTNTVMFSR